MVNSGCKNGDLRNDMNWLLTLLINNVVVMDVAFFPKTTRIRKVLDRLEVLLIN